MASLIASGSSSQVSSLVSVQEKGTRNKRKFRADPPSGEPNKIFPLPQNECLGYEFSAEKFEISTGHEQASACDLCNINQDHSDGLKLDLALSSSVGSSEAGPSLPKEELEADEFIGADWSDITEAQLEGLVLTNLDTIFRSAIKKIVACGYTEEVAIEAILRSGSRICYGCKDTVSNIVDNTLAFLRNVQDLDTSREHYFEDLQQMEKYVLAEFVCVLREVRTFFSTGDAMWCLLICDMNVSHACGMDGDPLGSFTSDSAPNGYSSIPIPPQSRTNAKGPDLNVSDPCRSIPSSSTQNYQSEAAAAAGVTDMVNLKNSQGVSGLGSEKEGIKSASDFPDKSFGTTGSSQSRKSEEKLGCSRKIHSSSTKRDYILRQKSFHVEKSYRTYGSKGSSRGGKLSGLILDKKIKSMSGSTTVNLKSASLKINKAMGVDVSEENINPCSSSNSKSSIPASFSLDNSDAISRSPKTNNLSSSPDINTSPALNSASVLSATDTELSLSLSSKSNPSTRPFICNVAEAPKSNIPGILLDKSLEQWVPRDQKEGMILKLITRSHELQNQLEEWTEWANQKVMQAARRLCKDKAELKTLRQEKEEVERLKKEKQTLEENTMKKLSEMENALGNTNRQVERANATVKRLEVENAALRQEMEAAKLRAAESAASCQEVSKREKKTHMKFQSWEKQKSLFQEELVAEKRKVAQLLQELEQAKALQEQIEARWEQEEKAKEELLMQASSIRKEREQIEVSVKSKEDMIKMKAEQNLQRYKDGIRELEKEISQLRLKIDSSKIAALKRGIDGSHRSRNTDMKSSPVEKDPRTSFISELVSDFHYYSETTGGVKRERECVMCLSEEMSVVFLPCAHQVVCTTCNELHERQGMKDCPSCRSPIQQRISVRYAHA